ncbi:hypothetical protein Tco_0565908 [Tanacetum coccineum]
MSCNSDDIQAAGSDTRPPMLDRTDYESWSQQIRLYCGGKENRLQILQSIDQGPLSLEPQRDATRNYPEGECIFAGQKGLYILGLPKDFYKSSITTIEAKAI